MELTKEQIREIYEQDIKPAFFNDVKSVSNPTLIVLAGQPGAGKQNIADLSVRELNNNAVVFNPDMLRVFHPDFNEKSQQFSGGTRDWKNMIIEDCIKEKKNMVMDITFGGNISVIEQDITKFKESGHKVKINALAVNDSVSKLGFNYRYEDQVSKYGHGRPVDLSYHNEIYKKIPHNMTTIIGKDLVDEVSVFKRNHETRKSEIIKTYDKAILRSSKDTPIYAYDRERCREFSDKEVVYLKEWYSKTEELSYKNGKTNPNLKNSITTDDNKASEVLKKQIAFITDTKMVQDLELKDAIKKNNPKGAYDAIKRGADIGSLTKKDFAGLNPIQEKTIKIEMQKALTEQLNVDQGQFQRTGKKL